MLRWMLHCYWMLMDAALDADGPTDSSRNDSWNRVAAAQRRQLEEVVRKRISGLKEPRPRKMKQMEAQVLRQSQGWYAAARSIQRTL